MTTLETSQDAIQAPLTLSLGVSPVRTFRWREIAQGSRVRGLAYGESTADLFARYDRASLSWKTSQACFLSGWGRFSETWPRSGMTRNGIAYQLPPLVPLTGETGYGLLPTLRTSRQKRAWKAYVRQNYQGNLEEFLGEHGFLGWISRQFCEWMMGYTLTWTDTKLSETQSFLKSRRSSSKRLKTAKA